MGLSGPVWCLIAGLGYGTLNVFAKLAYNKGLMVSRFVIIRNLVLFTCSYLNGKFVRKLDFDLRQYDSKVIKVLVSRSCLALISKTCLYASLSYIPLTIASTINFTTGPIFAAILAWCLIGEKLTCIETVIIQLGILGTTMLTMPQWFVFMGLDQQQISERFKDDKEHYPYYFIGIIMGLVSSSLDTVTYFMIRKLGAQIPSALIPFITGSF